jgi:murein L,D-transpeptidase YcbB/YkuD
MATPPTITEGATGPTVRWAQYLLVRRTLSDQQIDGIFGPVTTAAVEQFQRDSHLTVDGIVGPVTWAALGGDGPEPPTLAEGSTGAVVEKLQTALNEGRGDFAPGSNPVLAVDGSYGPKTAAAVRGAQELGGIQADGVVGLQTWALPVHAAGQVLADLCGVPGPGGG